MTTSFPALNGMAGAAYTLRAPARRDIEIVHGNWTIFLRSGAPLVTAVSNTSIPHDEILSASWRAVQEGLDIHAALFREPFGISKGDHESLLWRSESDGYHVTIADIIDSRWSMDATVTVGESASIPASTSARTVVQHHPALGYYRLSQLSDDLFDAFRNAYLALECVVSDVSKKGSSEKEADWLKRVLSNELLSAMPGGIDIDTFVTDIYFDARLPLFHAKIGNGFHLPYDEERAELRKAFDILSTVLVSLLKERISKDIPGGWGRMSQSVIDGAACASFAMDQVIFQGGGKSVACPVIFHLERGHRRFGNIWAHAEITVPELDELTGLAFAQGEVEFVSLSLLESIPLAGVAKIRIELNFLYLNNRAPKFLHKS